MPAYLIVDLTVTDPAGFEEYRRQVTATLERHGARYLVRGGAHQRLEGDWQPNRVVVIEFPSREAAQRWYDSEEYRGPKAVRQRTAVTNLILVDGV